MPNLRLLLGYRTTHRNNEPVVLLATLDGNAVQRAVNSAAAEFVRFELGVFTFQRQARRDGSAPEPEAQATSGQELPTLAEALEGLTEAGNRIFYLEGKVRGVREAKEEMERQLKQANDQVAVLIAEKGEMEKKLAVVTAEAKISVAEGEVGESAGTQKPAEVLPGEAKSDDRAEYDPLTEGSRAASDDEGPSLQPPGSARREETAGASQGSRRGQSRNH